MNSAHFQLSEQSAAQAAEMEQLLGRLLWAQLRAIGVGRDGRVTLTEATAAVPPSYRRWIEESLAVLVRHGLLRAEAGQCWSMAQAVPSDTEALWQQWHLCKPVWRQSRDIGAQVDILEVTLQALPAILRGEVAATAVMFPEGSMGLVEGVYKSNPGADYFNGKLADVACAFVRERRRRNPDESINILEVGAGTGATTAIVLEKLADLHSAIGEYCYTDISKAFLLNAEQRYGGQYPFLTFQLFDVEQALAAQAIVADRFDLVIAANVLHATRDIRRTLRNTKAAMHKNALLLLNEISSNTLFNHLTFALLEGWWRFEDAPLRIPGCPGLSPQGWQAVLDSEGFRSVFFPARAVHDLGLQIVAAESDGVVRQPPIAELPLQTTDIVIDEGAEESVGIGVDESVNGIGENTATVPEPQTPAVAEAPLTSVSTLTPRLAQTSPAVVSDEVLRDRTVRHLQQLVAKTLRLPLEQIEPGKDLASYGIDSILVVQMAKALGEQLRDVDGALFFEYRTVAALAEHFIATQRPQLLALLKLDRNTDREAPVGTAAVEPRRAEPERPALVPTNKRAAPPAQPTASPHDDIAIIGISGRYPLARDIETFWENLKAGKNCITEIPAQRWPLEDFFVADAKQAVASGKSYSKWGGFIDGFAEFDPLFFAISPREATNIDPQERLFLQICWQVLEDAGYTRAALQCRHGGRVGVFAGITKIGFNLYGPELWRRGEALFPSTSFSSVANRVSFLLDFCGPSLPIDTMCSASLTAVHEACEHIYRGDCELAIAGGVNLYLHPSSYVALCAQQMLSKDNKCRSFGSGGFGFVPGEGVGAVLLKPLAAAERDGDRIDALVRATAINHGGKTNGYTVPSPAAQAELIGRALQAAAIDPATIGYIEAHGTGTELGDPIEIRGLTQAFGQHAATAVTQYCAIGSIKSNLGHLESAAGIAALTKVVLQLRHRQLVPSINAEQTNPNINFTGTPFKLQQQLQDWQPPTSGPRRAGVSSFGAGGANAHVILQEYMAPPGADTAPRPSAGHPALVVLSARTDTQLQQRARDLYALVKRQTYTDADLFDMAYTLQVGREAMDERLAMAVADIDTLGDNLRRFIDADAQAADYYRGQAKKEQQALGLFDADEDLRAAVAAWIKKGKYHKLLELWVKGLNVDWQLLDYPYPPRRIRLPVYPFARKDYWLPAPSAVVDRAPVAGRASVASGSSSATADGPVVHRFLHRNTSTVAGLRFSSVLHAEDMFLRDHQIQKTPVLPGAVHIEMARRAVVEVLQVQPQQAVRLEKVTWLRPVAVAPQQSIAVHIDLTAASATTVHYDIYTRDAGGDKQLCSQGRGAVLERRAGEIIDLTALQQQCRDLSVDGARLYPLFAAMGIDYGPAHRGIEQLSIGLDTEHRPQVLARLILPEVAAHLREELVLHPSVVDSALQSAIGLSLHRGADTDSDGEPAAAKSALAFALASVDIVADCPAAAYAWVRFSAGSGPADPVQKLDIDICADDGGICLQLRGFAARMTDVDTGATAAVATPFNTDNHPYPQQLYRQLDGELAAAITPPVAEISAADAEVMDSLLAKLLLAQLQAMHIVVPDSDFSVGDSGLQHKPWLSQWLQASFDFLQRHDLITVTAESGRYRLRAPQSLEQNWRDWAQLKAGNAKLAEQVGLVESCLRELPAILTGRRPATDILFPNSSVDAVSGIYQGNAQSDYFNDILATAAVAIIEARLQQQADYRFRLLEIGAGTGGTSARLFQYLKPYQQSIEQYCYTDISQAFSIHARRTFAEAAPYLTTAHFNVEQPPGAQGIAEGSYDMVVATNVLHATGDIHNTLANAKACLKRNGFLLINEMTDNALFVHLTFGLLDGWWLYRDAALRIPGCPALAPPTWQQVLQREGFEPVIFAAELAHPLGQQIIAAESDGVVRVTERSVSMPARKAAPPVAEVAAAPTSTGAQSRDIGDDTLLADIVDVITEQLSTSLQIPGEELFSDKSFMDYGVDSITGVQLVQAINQALGLDMETTILFSYTSVDQLADYILAEHRAEVEVSLGAAAASAASSEPTPHSDGAATMVIEPSLQQRAAAPAVPPLGDKPVTAGAMAEATSRGDKAERIAVIGLSCRFPKSENAAQLWQHLAAGDDLIDAVNRWDLTAVDAGFADDRKGYCRHGGFLDDIDCFDPLFFNISAIEATYMDPQQRLFLQESWRALEDAGYAGASISGAECGVYVGVCEGYYHELIPSDAPAQAFWGNSSSILAARIAYLLDLQGPAVAIDTACSSSLVAVHTACRSLLAGDIELALSGGIMLHPVPGFWLSAGRAGMLSATGRCHTFDAGADGFVPGEGVGVVVLKRLSDALAAGDHLYGVVCGSDINQDGASNGITAPSGRAQERLQRRVYDRHGIDPEQIQMIEAHGTGTVLGDPIECQALIKAFRHYTDNTAYCALASIKTNIGHTATAAGIAGVIKVLLSLQQRKIPPSLHYRQLNPAIKLADSPFYINTELRDWQVAPGERRRAAVSSFGFSGTNAHIVIEEPPQPQTVHAARPAYLIALSAHSWEQVSQQARALIAHCRVQTQLDLGDISFTLLNGRRFFPCRLACVATDIEQLCARLQSWCEAAEVEVIEEGFYTGRAALGKRRRQATGQQSDTDCISACVQSKNKDDYWRQLAQVAELFTKGQVLDFARLFIESGPGQFRRVSLPTYPFAKERYWVEAQTPRDRDGDKATTLWLQSHWRQADDGDRAPSATSGGDHWLLLLGDFHRADTGFIEPDTLLVDLAAVGLDTVQCETIDSDAVDLDRRYRHCAAAVFARLQRILRDKARTPVLVQVAIGAFADADNACYAGLSGLLKTAMKENPAVFGQSIVFHEPINAPQLAQCLEREARQRRDQDIRYRDGERQVCRFELLADSNDGPPAGAVLWRDGGSYLISGGLGGLGFTVARAIAAAAREVKLVLLGRRAAGAAQQAQLRELRELGAEVRYLAVDIADRPALQAAMARLPALAASCNGIVHCAGTIADNFMIKKSAAEFDRVLAAKVSGLIHLDQLTAGAPLEFFALFSSGSVAGNAGQADYAAANGFMDAYAARRQQQVVTGKRRGRTLSLNWPLWEGGGMQVDVPMREEMAASGLLPLSDDAGLAALAQSFAFEGDFAQLMILHGEREKLLQLVAPPPAAQAMVISATAAVGDAALLKQNALRQLQTLLSGVSGVERGRIEADLPFETYGLDSIMVAELNRRLEQQLGKIPKTLFYEYLCLDELCDHLVAAYPNAWQGEVSAALKPAPVGATAAVSTVPPGDDIAIIGLSCHFPQAGDLSQFWTLLRDGKHCIAEIPPQRWPVDGFYHSDPTEAVLQGKSYCKWGGFIDDFAAFDPLFFAMPPREADYIDPQERLFLQTCCAALEDAGLVSASFSASLRQRSAVFGGITKQGFNLHGAALGGAPTNTSFASLANRVSYYLNLQGPSGVVDTMCSSALVAIHNGCDYIRRGEGELALAGGVNLYLHPSNYISASAAQLLAAGPDCRAFAAGGSGFVPGEGTGVVVLKSLAQAQRDGDDIYAVIRASAVNHNGKTNGYTTPSPTRQAAVIEMALARAGIDPRSIAYIEAAANGSEMGDAIEMAALQKVFSDRRDCRGPYRVGSVKPNLGHSESASGMAQLAKVILALRHRQFPPTLVDSPTPNPAIDFDTLPFSLSRRLETWDSLLVDGEAVPRRAGISGVGAGGVNAHLIVEEYTVDAAAAAADIAPADGERDWLFVFSAKTRERLQAYAERWCHYLVECGEVVDCRRLAYTLQIGRQAMKCRLAVVAAGAGQLRERLSAWLDDPAAANCYCGEANTAAAEINGDGGKETIAGHIAANNGAALAACWIDGADLPWRDFYPAGLPRKLHQLPTYPFAPRLCWPGSSPSSAVAAAKATTTNGDTAMLSSEEPTNKAVEFYSVAAMATQDQYFEDYLTFAPFAERIPGFSYTNLCLDKEKYAREWDYVKVKQKELRQVLFCKEDFQRIDAVFDFGCGHGTDVIQIARLYPHIKTCGYTITGAQAELGNKRIAELGLGERAGIFNNDSAKVAFPERQDLIFGIEVSFHIRDKQALFGHINRALKEGGHLLLMDYTANLRGGIGDPKVEITIPTVPEWVALLSANQLVIDELIDVSAEISNFLYDPDFEQHIRGLPAVVIDTLRNYANQSISLERGWISYSLFKIRKDSSLDRQQLRDINARRLANMTPYAQALEAMLASGHIPYPPPAATAAVDTVAAAPIPKTDAVITSSKSVDSGAIRDSLLAIFKQVLGLEAADIEATESLAELGIGSMNAVVLLEAINTHFDLTMPTSVLFECHSVEALADMIARQLPAVAERRGDSERGHAVAAPPPAPVVPAPPTLPPVTPIPVAMPSAVETPSGSVDRHTDGDAAIAIVGLSCRCAGADNAAEFWRLISEGKSAISAFQRRDWIDFVAANGLEEQTFCYGAMADIEAFDPLFFRISPSEAQAMDPAQRILLQECYRALEDAGYSPAALQGQQIATVIGSMGATATGRDFSHFSMLGAETSILSSRIAYFLDLKGPALTINTSCSSSLVAVDTACQKLRNGSVAAALAGGIGIYTHPGAFVSMQRANMLSATGQCRPFDDVADGIVVGDGVGVVILKRLADALADGDHIYGVIRGSGTNQDGRTSGITVPSFVSQSQLQASVYRDYDIDVEDIHYIESHGTATNLGDPVEIHALNDAFGQFSDKKTYCAIGSVKANIGHTGAAAGVLSLIKVLLCLQQRQLPPAINFTRHNSHIDFDHSPVYVNTTLKDWPANRKGSRLAAINSFGFSGTNAHLVVEDFSGQVSRAAAPTMPVIIVLSAKSQPQLRQLADGLRQRLQAEKYRDEDLPSIAFTLQTGRDALEHRLALPVDTIADLNAKLEQFFAGDADSAALGGIYCGQVEKQRNSLAWFSADEELREVVGKWIARGKFARLLELWVKGLAVDWFELYREGRPGRVSLPTYPFEKKTFALPAIAAPAAAAPVAAAAHSPSAVNSVATDDRLPQRALRELNGTGSLLNLVPSPGSQLSEQEVESLQYLLPRLLLSQLDRIGLFKRGGRRKVAVRHQRWMQASLSLLQKFALIEETTTADDDYRLLEPVRAESLWQQWQQLKDGRVQLAVQMELVERMVQAYDAILSDKKPATDILFANTSMDIVGTLYQADPLSVFYNEVLVTALVALVDERLRRQPDCALRMLEIGAGTGGTSAAVFERLQPYAEHIELYNYTDISHAFLSHAKRRFSAQAPYMRTQLLDVEKSFAAQGDSIDGYDFVLATNVLHATQDISRTLVNTRACLKPDGVLLLNEMSDFSLLSHMVFGLLDGWWRFTDEALRIPGCPGLYPHVWDQVLRESGFQQVLFPARDAHALGQQVIVASGLAQPPIEADGRSVSAAIIDQLSQCLNMPAADIDSRESFMDYGVDSITGIKLVEGINAALQIQLETTSLFSYPSVEKLTDYITREFNPSSERQAAFESPLSAGLTASAAPPAASAPYRNSSPRLRDEHEQQVPEAIAIVGISGRFAKSANLDELWQHLARGDDLVETVSRWDLAQLDSGFANDARGYCRYGSFIDDIDYFDASFFNISAREATYMDPQQRLFLEESWKALENAGYGGEAIEGSRCGVYVGCAASEYTQLFQYRRDGDDIPAQAFWGNAESILPTRIAYFLDLLGPAVAVNTACSSSLVVTHMACQSLRAGEVDMALAGGITLMVTPSYYLSAGRAGMLSAGGHCYSFDARADGFVPGEGVGVVVLKRLGDAIDHGDHICGVIRGSGLNQDGTSNGITAPSARSQELLEREVYDNFGIDPRDIDMVEAHGTGTELGDPIEYQALTKAFRHYTDEKEVCALGSIKTNLGHTGIPAGITGVFKILLSLRHHKIPPSLHYQSANPVIDMSDSPFYVNTTLRDWPRRGDRPRCAALSSFGFSGTNVHMVIAEAPAIERAPVQQPAYLIVLSARTEEALAQQVQQLRQHCLGEPAIDLGDMSFTLLTGRRAFEYRLATVVSSREQLLQRLQRWRPQHPQTTAATAEVLWAFAKPKQQWEQDALRDEGNACLAACCEAGSTGEYTDALLALAERFVRGFALDYHALFRGDYRRLPLPTYPFARERYWVEAGAAGAELSTPESVDKLLTALQQGDLSVAEVSDAI